MTVQDVKMEIIMRDVFQQLKNAVDDYVAYDGGSVTNMYIITPAGAAFKLDNITVPNLNGLTGIRIHIGAITFDIPLVNIGVLSPTFGILQMLGAVIDPAVPGSENWLYGGPLREGIWPPKVGTDPAFSEVQYYKMSDGVIDGFIGSLIVAIAYGLVKVGLYLVVERFLKKIFSRSTINLTRETAQILNTVNNINTVLGATQTTVNSIQSTTTTINTNLGSGNVTTLLTTANGLINLIKLIVDKVEVQVLRGDTEPSIIDSVDSIMNELGITITDPLTLNEKVDEIRRRGPPRF